MLFSQVGDAQARVDEMKNDLQGLRIEVQEKS